MPKTNRETFGLDWIKEGFAPELLRNHMLYLEKLVDRINHLVRKSLSEIFEEEKETIPTNPHERNLYVEVIQHVTFCQQRSVCIHSAKIECIWCPKTDITVCLLNIVYWIYSN